METLLRSIEASNPASNPASETHTKTKDTAVGGESLKDKDDKEHKEGKERKEGKEGKEATMEGKENLKRHWEPWGG